MKLPVAQIVVDHGFYPRTNVDPDYVELLIDAIRSGAELPPVVVEDKTNRLVDGFHRLTALRRIRGRGEVEVQVVRYADDAAFFLDAVRRNSAHGRRFVADDVIRIRRIAEGTLEVDPARVAASLTMTKVRMSSEYKLFTVPPARRGRPPGSGSTNGHPRGPRPTTRAPSPPSRPTADPDFLGHVAALTTALREGKWPSDDLEVRISLDELRTLLAIELKKVSG